MSKLQKSNIIYMIISHIIIANVCDTYVSGFTE